MFRSGIVACAAVMIPAFATAQSAPTTITAVPAPDAGNVCYYAGLAYSKDALLTVDVPFRRESPEALQKQLLICSESKDGGGLLWATTELRGPGNN